MYKDGMDLESGRPKQEVIQNRKDFRSLLNITAGKTVKSPLRQLDF